MPRDLLALHVTVDDDDSLDMEEALSKSIARGGWGAGTLVISFLATAGQIAYWKIKVMVN